VILDGFWIARGVRGGKTPDAVVQGHTSPFPRGVDCAKSRPSGILAGLSAA